MATRIERATRSRAALVEAARQCFTERGYEDTTVAEILERAGMARGALYHYFPGGKAEIFGAVFETINDEFHRRRDAVSELTSPLDQLVAGIGVFLRMCRDEDFARIALTDAPRLIPGQSELGSSYRMLRDGLARAAAAGELDQVDVDASAMALYGAVRSAGEYVIAAWNRTAAVTHSTAVLERFLEGLRRRS